MAKTIIPVIPVPRSILERLAKARAGLVQKRVQVKTRHGNHYRMQWVRPENDSSWGGSQASLFDDSGRPNEAAVPVASKKKSSGDYKIYHDSLTAAINEVIRYIDDQGLYLSENDVFNDISTGPAKPSEGKTNRYSMPLFDADGKPAKKAVHFQVYGMGNGRYELNMYTSPMKEKDYIETGAQVRKPDGALQPPAPAADSATEQGFKLGKKYRHKKDGWEATYAGLGTIDAVDGLDENGNLKHKLIDAHKMNVTKPGVFKYAPMGTVGEWTGRFKPEEFDEVANEDANLTNKPQPSVAYWRTMLKETEENIARLESTIAKWKELGATDSVPHVEKQLAQQREEAESLRLMITGAESKHTNESPFKVETVASHDDKENGVRTELFKYVDGKNAGKYGLRVIDTDAGELVPSIRQFTDEAMARLAFAEAAGIKRAADGVDTAIERVQADYDKAKSDGRLQDMYYANEMLAGLKRQKGGDNSGNKSVPATYENRKLGMQRARTRPDDEYSTEAMAEIALSNLKPGERFPVGRTWYTVSAITDKTLTITSDDGEKKTLKPNGAKWQGFVRDVGGAMLGWHHGVDAGDLVSAFRRDPAARYDGQMLSIQDTIPAVKKSIIESFREGLAKAFGRG